MHPNVSYPGRWSAVNEHIWTAGSNWPYYRMSTCHTGMCICGARSMHTYTGISGWGYSVYVECFGIVLIVNNNGEHNLVCSYSTERRP